MDSNNYFGFNPLKDSLLNPSSSIKQENFQQTENISGFNNQLFSSAANFQVMPNNQFSPFPNVFHSTELNYPSIQQNQNFDINRYDNEQINVIPNYQEINNEIRESIELNQDTFSNINPRTFLTTNQNIGETEYTMNLQQNIPPTNMSNQYDEIIQYINNQYFQNANNIVNFENNQFNKNVSQGPFPSKKYENLHANDYSFKEPIISEDESNYLLNQNTLNHNDEEIPSLDSLPLASDVLESGLDLKNTEPIPSLEKGTQFSEYRTTPKINEIKTEYITKMPPISAIPEIPPISAIPEIPPISAIPEIPPISATPEIPPISAIPEIPLITENQISQMTPVSQVPHIEDINPPPLQPVLPTVKSLEKILIKIPKIQKVIVPKIQKVIIPSKSKIFITKTNTISTEPISITNHEPFQVQFPSNSTIPSPIPSPLFGPNTLGTEINIPSKTVTVPNSIPFQTQTMVQTHIPITSTIITPGISMPISTQINPTLSQTQIPMTKTIIPIQTNIPYNKYNIKTKSVDYASSQLIPSQIPITQISPSLQQAHNFSQIPQNSFHPIYQQGLPINRAQVPSLPQYQYSLRTFTPLRKDNLINQNIYHNRAREYNASTFRPLLNRNPSFDKIRGKINVFSPPRYINRTYMPRKL